MPARSRVPWLPSMVVKRIIDECYDKAKAIILDHRDVLESCTALLIENEKIGQEEFEALFRK